MKKRNIFSLLTAFVMLALVFLPSLSAVNVKAAGEVLRVYNWQDYIDEDVVSDFEKEYGVTVEYSTFGTNENMYNELKINPDSYDLVCPSDYMIQRLIKENMLEKFDGKIENYENYGSKYFKDLFATNGWTDYAVGYMWGTLGLVYNPDLVSDYDMQSYTSLWSVLYKGDSTIKDSIRDTYFLGVAFVYREELNALADKYEKGTITEEAYNARLNEVFNDTSAETVAKVESSLKALKSNIYGFEVDSGKNDMITGKITINFAWSGDGAYAIGEAADNGVTLKYSVPLEGSNVWFDGWCIPKGGNVQLAEKFVDFLCRPEIAIRNMEYIGYTSSIAGEEVYSWVKESYELTEEANEENVYASDISYFFEGIEEDGVVYSSDYNGIFNAQYPDYGTIARCAIMQNYDDAAQLRINDMWENIKGFEFPVWAIIVIIAAVVVIVAAIVLYKFKDKLFGKKKSGKFKVVSKG